MDSAWRRGRAIQERAHFIGARSFRALANIGRNTVSHLPGDVQLHSIKSKIVVFAVITALIPTLATSMIAYSNSRQALTDGLTEALQSGSVQAARELDLWFDDRFRDLRVFASSYEVAENLETIGTQGSDAGAIATSVNRLTNYLEVLGGQFPDYLELLAMDLRGLVVASSAPHHASPRLPSGWLNEISAAPVVHGAPYHDELLGAPITTFGVPVRSADGRLTGALAAKLKLDAAREILSDITPGGAGRVLLATVDGTFVLGSPADGQQTGELTLADAAIHAIHQGLTRPVRYIDPAGIEVVGSYKRLASLNWVAIAEVSEKEAYRQVVRLRNLTILVVATLLIAIGFIAYRLGLLIVRPLDGLSKAAAEVASGDLAVDLPVMGGGEVSYLTAVFNNMVARLREGREKLDAIHEKLRLKNEELERLSITDGLTGLYNRRFLMESLDREARRTRRSRHPFSVLMVDVDHFKQLNDTYGHKVGDDVLARLASILLMATRDVDSVARYGGEEFVLLLPETEAQGAMIAAERIRERLEAEGFEVMGNRISVTVSIGVAEFPGDGDSLEALLMSADRALYQAKDKGRDRAVGARRPHATRKAEEQAAASPRKPS